MKEEPGSDSRRAAIERLFEHGGDINSAIAAFPDAPRPWIDLSTGAQPGRLPRAPNCRPRSGRGCRRPPALRGSTGRRGARLWRRAGDCVAAAAGTQAILQILPHLFPARRVSILGPTYDEHARTWTAAGAEVEIVGDLEAATAEQVVVANPNNPDGRIFSRSQMSAYARRLAGEGRRLIVDEAFMDFEEQSVARRKPAGDDRAALVRQGLRIGGPAARLRDRAAGDRRRTSRRARPLAGFGTGDRYRSRGARGCGLACRRPPPPRQRRRLGWTTRFPRAGFEIVGGTRLFRLARRADAAEAFAGLCARGILTRPFRWDSALLRFAIPTEEQRARIGDALRST